MERKIKPSQKSAQFKNVFSGKWQSIASISTDKHPSLNILSLFYNKMASKLKKSTYLQILSGVIPPKYPPKPTKTFWFSNISVLFVQKELKLLSHQKSTGVDNLPPGLLRDCGSIIWKPLCHITNLSIRLRFSSCWKVAKVTKVAEIIFKYGSCSLPVSNRQIWYCWLFWNFSRKLCNKFWKIIFKTKTSYPKTNMDLERNTQLRQLQYIFTIHFVHKWIMVS